MLKICNEVWRSKKWPTKWTQSLIITLPKKGNLRKCNNYRTISLISHPSKVLLTVIKNRLKQRAESILAEEQAGFRTGRSTIEQITNVRILGEKYRNHQKELHHNFIDFKKAFDRVWRKALWEIMKKHNMGTELVKVIETLYENSSNAVLMDGSDLQWFKTTVGVRQGCILSPCLFNIFLEQIMTDALESFEGSVGVGGRKFNNLRFADDIDLLAGSREELKELTERLDETTRRYGMEISAEKSKIMGTSRIRDNVEQTHLEVSGEKLEEVNTFQYLGSTLNSEMTSITEVKNRLAVATSQLAKCDKLWKATNIDMKVKTKLAWSLITSITLYGCETWTYSKNIEKKLRAFEYRCYRRLLNITWKDRVRNDEVLRRMKQYLGEMVPLVMTARRRKLQWFGHTTRRMGSLAHTIMHGSVEGERRRGRQRSTWLDDIKKWTELSMTEAMDEAMDRVRWRRRIEASMYPNGHGYG